MHSGVLAMNNWKDFRRILVEETIRLMALEVVIGLTPVGIADAMGVELQTLYRVASISLSIPVVIWVVMIVIRTRKKVKLTQVTSRWQMNRKAWIALGIGVILTTLLTLFYSLRGVLTGGEVIKIILFQFFVVGLGVWLSLRRKRQ
jgi:heme/copper-type cytochrome/quinol oxidase subunit 2